MNNSNMYIKKTPIPIQVERKAKLLEMAKGACNKGGGYALIDDNFAFVDTRKYNVTLKE